MSKKAVDFYKRANEFCFVANSANFERNHNPSYLVEFKKTFAYFCILCRQTPYQFTTTYDAYLIWRLLFGRMLMGTSNSC